MYYSGCGECGGSEFAVGSICSSHTSGGRLSYENERLTAAAAALAAASAVAVGWAVCVYVCMRVMTTTSGASTTVDLLLARRRCRLRWVTTSPADCPSSSFRSAAMLEPSSSEESDVDGDEPGFGAAGGGLDATRTGRPIPVLGGRVAGFVSVGSFGFCQSGLAGALNSGVSTSLSSNTSLIPSSTSSIAPPNIDLLQQRSHSLSTGILSTCAQCSVLFFVSFLCCTTRQ